MEEGIFKEIIDETERAGRNQGKKVRKRQDKDSKMHRYKQGSRKLLKSKSFDMQKRKMKVLHSKVSEKKQKKQDICLHKLMQGRKVWQSSGREC